MKFPKFHPILSLLRKVGNIKIKYPYLTSILTIFLVIIGLFVFYHSKQRKDILSVYSHLDQNPKPITRELPSKDDQEYIRILAIEGGGVYGLLPAHVLKYIEDRAKKPIAELFDVVMGTSTGALLSVLFNVPGEEGQVKYSASEILDIYNEDGKWIFYSPWYHRILTLNGLLGPKYMTAERYRIFEKYLGNLYFDQLLNNVIIPAYGVDQQSPLLFINWKEQGMDDVNFAVSDLLMGAVSPPGFFPSVVFGSRQNKYVLADGALFANNPSLAAVLIAMKNYPNKKYILVSLGTGELKSDKKKPDEVIDWGDIQWGAEIIPVLLDSSMKFDNVLLEKAFPFPVEVFRFNKKISGLKKVIDDITPENLKRLNFEGESIVKKNKKRLNALIPKLKRP